LDRQVVRQYPQIAVLITGDASDRIAGQPVVGRIGGEDALTQPSHTAVLRARPQIALTTFIKTVEAIAGDARRIALVEDHEAHAIEADQTVRSGQPEIPVASLADGMYRVLRQAIIRCPLIEAVLRLRDGV
jgi:hypothetical protein